MARRLLKCKADTGRLPAGACLPGSPTVETGLAGIPVPANRMLAHARHRPAEAANPIHRPLSMPSENPCQGAAYCRPSIAAAGCLSRTGRDRRPQPSHRRYRRVAQGGAQTRGNEADGAARGVFRRYNPRSAMSLQDLGPIPVPRSKATPLLTPANKVCSSKSHGQLTTSIRRSATSAASATDSNAAKRPASQSRCGNPTCGPRSRCHTRAVLWFPPGRSGHDADMHQAFDQFNARPQFDARPVVHHQSCITGAAGWDEPEVHDIVPQI